jgi:hypothetical protein
VRTKPEFNEVLIQAIDDALSSLGGAPKTAIYQHLEHNFNIKKTEIPEKISDFSDALEKIFGFGARNLEILFMKYLHSKIGITCECITKDWRLQELTFQEYVNLMRQKFEETDKNREQMEVLVDANEEQKQYN